jgi:hypothetical protein
MTATLLVSIVGIQSGSGVSRHLACPETFEIPAYEERLAIEPGVVVRLMFEMNDGWCERMWVRVTTGGERHLTRVLISRPFAIPRLSDGATIKFKRHHVIDIHWPRALDSRTDAAPSRVRATQG